MQRLPRPLVSSFLEAMVLMVMNTASQSQLLHVTTIPNGLSLMDCKHLDMLTELLSTTKKSMLLEGATISKFKALNYITSETTGICENHFQGIPKSGA